MDVVTYDAIVDISAQIYHHDYAAYRFFGLNGVRRTFGEMNSEQIDGYAFFSFSKDYSDVRCFRVEFDLNGDIYTWREYAT
jgi:hypothetical protein